MQTTDPRTNSRILGHVAAGLTILCALVIFWQPADPLLRYKSVTTWYVTQDQMVPTEQVVAEAAQLTTQITRFSDSGELTPERMFALQKRLRWLLKHSEQYGPQPRLGHVLMDGAIMMRLAAVRDGSPQFRQYSKEEAERFRSFFTTDPEYLQTERFRASDTTNNWPVVAARYVQRYMMSIPLGVLICLVLMFRDGRKFTHALGIAFNHRLKMVFYPVGIIWVLLGVEWEDYREGARRAIGWLSYATAASVSVFFGGIASAQTVKKDEKKKSSAYALQLDSRVVVPIEGPLPSLFNRTTLNAKSWLIESISTATPEIKNWYNETGFGVKVVRTPNTTINLMGIVSADSAGTHKVMAGMQYFRSGPLATIAIPVIRFEKTLGGPLAFTVATNPLFRFGRERIRNRLALSPDGNVRKIAGKPLSWTAGLGLDVFPRKGKGDRIEVALLRNSTRQWQLRGRYVVNFAF